MVFLYVFRPDPRLTVLSPSFQLYTLTYKGVCVFLNHLNSQVADKMSHYSFIFQHVLLKSRHNLYHYNTVIKIRKFTPIWFYHLIHRPYPFYQLIMCFLFVCLFICFTRSRIHFRKQVAFICLHLLQYWAVTQIFSCL